MRYATEDALLVQIDQLRKALEPFQRDVDAVSLFHALKHIGREELYNARRAYELVTYECTDA